MGQNIKFSTCHEKKKTSFIFVIPPFLSKHVFREDKWISLVKNLCFVNIQIVLLDTYYP